MKIFVIQWIFFLWRVIFLNPYINLISFTSMNFDKLKKLAQIKVFRKLEHVTSTHVDYYDRLNWFTFLNDQIWRHPVCSTSYGDSVPTQILATCIGTWRDISNVLKSLILSQMQFFRALFIHVILWILTDELFKLKFDCCGWRCNCHGHSCSNK